MLEQRPRFGATVVVDRKGGVDRQVLDVDPQQSPGQLRDAAVRAIQISQLDLVVALEIRLDRVAPLAQERYEADQFPRFLNPAAFPQARKSSMYSES